MTVLFLEWNSYGNQDMLEALECLGFQAYRCRLSKGIQTDIKEIEEVLRLGLQESRPEFIFSFNYIPAVSQICQEYEIPYASWIYDSPYIHVYSYTVLNPCNYIFLFDYALYQKLAGAGITTVYYLPLAVNEKRLSNLQNTDLLKEKYQADISFVGALYDEPKHRLFDKFQNVTPYVRGYLEAVTAAQKLVYGYNFLEELLNPSIIAEMEKAYPTDPNATTAMKPEEIYADYVLSRHVTAMERREILEMLGREFPGYTTRLYTNNKEVQIPGIINEGAVDYYEEMPFVFANSKINLNISLRSIRTGIPLRAFDIMGCGGFLLSNYQQELAEYFVADEDFVYYDNYEDLMEKTEYYLLHDKERKEIAENGAEKTLRDHTMVKRAEEMIKLILNF